MTTLLKYNMDNKINNFTVFTNLELSDIFSVCVTGNAKMCRVIRRHHYSRFNLTEVDL